MTDLEPEPDEHRWVARLLADDDPGPMPEPVSRRIEAVLRRGAPTGTAAPAAVWPTATPVGTAESRTTGARTDAAARIDEAPLGDATQRVAPLSGPRRSGRAEAAEDRRRMLLYRALPAAAAAVVVVGAIVVGVSQLGGQDTADTAVPLEDASGDGGAVEEAEALVDPDAPPAPPPNGLVATGTAYTADTLPEAARTLVSAVSGAGGEALAEDGAPEAPSPEGGAASPEGGAAAAQDVVEASSLASARVYGECARQLGAPEGQLPLAVDLATYEGAEAAIVVLADPAGGLEVVVTDRDCTPGSQRTAVLVPAEE